VGTDWGKVGEMCDKLEKEWGPSKKWEIGEWDVGMSGVSRWVGRWN